MSRRTRPRADQGERGFALAFFAISLVVLMIFAAFVVDLGAAYVERRDDQNAADAGALAGAVELAFATQGASAQDILTEAMAAVEGTLGLDISDAEWADATNCPNEPPADFLRLSDTRLRLGPTTPDTPCISINRVFDTIRVRVPERTVATHFARVIGINEITVTAAAEASIRLPVPVLLPPFAVAAGVSGGDSVCLVTSGGPQNRNDSDDTNNGNVMWSSLPPLPWNGQVDPCDNDATTIGSGQFGTLLPTTYNRSDCGASLSANEVVELAIAEGVDHLLSRYPSPFNSALPNVYTRQDGALCSSGIAGPVFPNAMTINTGFSSASLVTCGLMGEARGDCSGAGPVFDGELVPGRFRTGLHATGANSTEFGGRPIDGVAPWAFLDTDNTDVDCVLSSYRNDSAGFVENWTRFQRCLDDWSAPDGALFSMNIINTSRFSFIPLVAQTDFPTAPSCGSLGGITSSGGTCVQFEEFAPIYFHRLYGVATGSGGGSEACSVAFTDDGSNGNRRPLIQTVGDDGGVTTDECGRNGQLVHRLAGMVFDCRMLPDDLCVSRPGETPPPGGDIMFDIYLTD